MLARIPDVAALIDSRPQRRQPVTTTPSRGIDYRFDPPQPRAEHHLSALAVDNVPTAGGAVPLAPPAHHWFRRSASSRPTSRAARPASSVLPDSDPFSPSGGVTEERIATIVRFLVVAALFAIAGMSVLLIYRLGPEPEHSAPPAHGAAAGRTVVAPTAAGPLTTAIGRENSNQESSVESRGTDNPVRRSEMLDRSARPAFDTRTSILEPPPLTPSPPELPYPTTGYPAVAIGEMPEFVSASGPPSAGDASHKAGDAIAGLVTGQPPAVTEIPRVRTDDHAPATARLSGQVQQVPTRQAQHDKHESSLH